jgi:hypothetical protein
MKCLMEALVAVREKAGWYETSSVVVVVVVGRMVDSVSRTNIFHHIVCNANLIVQQCYDDCDLYAWRLCAADAFLKTGVSARWGD